MLCTIYENKGHQSCKLSRAFGSGQVGLRFIKMFRTDFGPAYTTFFATTHTFFASYCWSNRADWIISKND